MVVRMSFVVVVVAVDLEETLFHQWLHSNRDFGANHWKQTDLQHSSFSVGTRMWSVLQMVLKKVALIVHLGTIHGKVHV